MEKAPCARRSMNAQGFSVGRENDAGKAENENKKRPIPAYTPYHNMRHISNVLSMALSIAFINGFYRKKLGQPLCYRDRILPYHPLQCHTTPCQAIPMPPHGISLKKTCVGRFNKAKPSIKISPRPARGHPAIGAGCRCRDRRHGGRIGGA